MRWGVNLSQTGHDVAPIVYLRDTLHGQAAPDYIEAAFVVALAHTHWHSRLRTVISYSKERDCYFIGPRDVFYPDKLTAVSFAHIGGEFVAYEWADPSCCLNQYHINTCYQIIKSIEAKVDRNIHPFGLSLNFRFKSLDDNDHVPVIENPYSGIVDEYEEASIIERTQFLEIVSGRSAEMVAWNCRSDLSYDLSFEEAKILNDLRSLKNAAWKNLSV